MYYPDPCPLQSCAGRSHSDSMDLQTSTVPSCSSQPARISAKFYVTSSLRGLPRAIGSVARHISGSNALCPSMKNTLWVSRKSNLCPVGAKSLCSILLQDQTHLRNRIDQLHVMLHLAITHELSIQYCVFTCSIQVKFSENKILNI